MAGMISPARPGRGNQEAGERRCTPRRSPANPEDLNNDVDEELGTPQALCCGGLIAHTLQYGLSLGECLCLTVSAWGGATAVSADRLVLWMPANVSLRL